MGSARRLRPFRPASLAPLPLACAAASSAACSLGDGASHDGPLDAPDAARAADAGAADAPPGMPDDPGHRDGDAEAGDAGELWVNPALCDDGGIGATFRGIPAYCQLAGTNGGNGFYQCDELANRFMRDALQHPDLDNVLTDYASTICGKAAAMPQYSVWGPGYRATAGKKPAPGDFLVFNGTPGHVAIVVDASGATSLRIMQQNAANPVDAIGWVEQTSFFADLGIDAAECWVHAEPAAPAPPPSGPPCGCFDGDGDYCGLALVDHAWWSGCSVSVEGADGGGAAPSYGTLYTCTGGAITVKQVCGAQCLTAFVMPATGVCGTP